MATNSNQGGGNDRLSDAPSQTLEVLRPRPLPPLSTLPSFHRRHEELEERERRLQQARSAAAGYHDSPGHGLAYSDDGEENELRPGAVCVTLDEQRRIHSHHLGEFALRKGEYTRERRDENMIANEARPNESPPSVAISEQSHSRLSPPTTTSDARRSPAVRLEQHQFHGISNTIIGQSGRVMTVLETLNTEQKVSIEKGESPLCGKYAMGCILVCFVAIASGMIALLFSEPSTGGSGIFIPTPSPTTVFTTKALEGLVKARLPSTSFSDPKSPQGRALDWLAHQDPHAHVIASNDDFFGNAIIQRFALTTLYFALHGRHGKGDDGWLENVSECEWGVVGGIVCDEYLGRAMELNLASSGLVGQIPPEIGLLTHLTKIKFDVNQITGTIPSEIGLLTGLEILILNHNQLRGTIPDSIVHMKNLEQLALFWNSISGTLPHAMHNLSSLRILRLEGNKLAGTIPTSLGSLVSLETIKLDNNRFTGTLPTELGKLSDNLRYFFALDNDLEGTIPTEFGELGALKVLDVSANAFSGNIPTQLGNCHQIYDLDLGMNRLEGTLPTQILLPALTSLKINDNQLNGTLPEAQLSQLINLTPGQLYIFRNKLRGSLPNTLCYAMPEVDCPDVHCECCRSSTSIPCTT